MVRCGADPEVFLCNDAGKPISSIGYIGADKWNPLQIPDMPKGFTLQEDNVSLEYGIPPAASADEFVAHITSVMEKSKEYVKGLSFSKLSCIIFPEDQMQTPEAFTFGCEPDYNAYTKHCNPKPNPPHPLMRSAGGHVHVETKVSPWKGVPLMDLFLSVPAVLMDDGIERKKLYGSAGACRIKPYGFEYRTLSNFWIFEEKYIRWVFNNTNRAMDFQGNISPDYILIEQTINQNNAETAKYLIEKYSLEVV